jgi:uncharacterized repeat protein (TIGR01451 family)
MKPRKSFPPDTRFIVSAWLCAACFVLFATLAPRALIAGGIKTGGGWEISNDVIDAAGTVGRNGGIYWAIDAAGQSVGYASMAIGIYSIEGGYVSGVVSSLSATGTVVSVTAPVAYTGAPTDPVPGAKVRFRIDFANFGEAAQTGTPLVQNPVPANMTYASGTITLNGVAKSDTVDGDECRFDPAAGGSVMCTMPDLAAGATGVLMFDAIIN